MAADIAAQQHGVLAEIRIERRDAVAGTDNARGGGKDVAKRDEALAKVKGLLG